MSSFLINSALKKEIIKIDGIEELSNELRRIGVNLNQLTKLCHEGKISAIDLSNTKDEVTKIWQLLSLLTQKIV